MSRPIIEVSAVSKCYRLGAIGTTSVREEFNRLWDRARGRAHPDRQEFWALRDVSFSAQPGEVVGVIGRNGAGKSTLLKILSRITEPTSGRATLRGRVASLLEVGTGFHPELSGRENVFLNGAILGMSRAEVRTKFDEIVAFAEVEKFIDTPVKRYSSGMYVRLAFAVAAHLEPEILIVDEVLAVGDVQFQRKCMGKIEAVAHGQGRTIIFVSHNMDAVFRLCSTCVWLEKGVVAEQGPTGPVVAEYMRRASALGLDRPLIQRPRDPRLRQQARIVQFGTAHTGGSAWVVPFNGPLTFTAQIEILGRQRGLVFAIAIFSSGGTEIASSRMPVLSGQEVVPGLHEFTFTLPDLRLSVQRFTCNLGLISDSGDEDFIENAAAFEISSNPQSASERADLIHAAVIPRVEFALRRLN